MQYRLHNEVPKQAAESAKNMRTLIFFLLIFFLNCENHMKNLQSGRRSFTSVCMSRLLHVVSHLHLAAGDIIPFAWKCSQ